MKISFVIPAYNEEALIGKCLLSVQQEIARVRAPGSNLEIEVVVVNNASSDHTKEIAQSFVGVRVVDEMHKGLVRARKAGFNATDGELIANIDADTMLPPGWLNEVMSEFQNDSALVALSGPFIYYDLPFSKRMFVRPWYFLGWLFLGFRIQGGNFVIRRDAWERVGGFDTSIEFYGEDADVAKRLKKAGKVTWSWKLPIYASGRRLKGEGIFKTSFNYGANLVWVGISGRPVTKKHADIRHQ
ncbi:MAG TPA: glycosyltransferase family A protein [Candidatus Paceibacterota bacterium]